MGDTRLNTNEHGFTLVNNTLFEQNLTHIEFRVLMYIIKWANTSKPLSFSYISANTQMSRSSAQKAASTLIDKNLIEQVKSTNSTTYIPHSSLLVKPKKDIK